MSDIIVLVGLPGAGKSEVGRGLAIRLDQPFCDLDALIVEREGRSVVDLFSEGEAVFRQAESAALQEALLAPGVIATGGGVVLAPENRAAMHDSATVVWLQVAPSVAADRIARDDVVRPLISDAADLARLEEQRRVLYEGIADVIVDADASPADVVARVITELKAA